MPLARPRSCARCFLLGGVNYVGLPHEAEGSTAIKRSAIRLQRDIGSHAGVAATRRAMAAAVRVLEGCDEKGQVAWTRLARRIRRCCKGGRPRAEAGDVGFGSNMDWNAAGSSVKGVSGLPARMSILLMVKC